MSGKVADISSGRDGSGTGGVGILRNVDGELFIDEIPFTRYFDQFTDKYCEFSFFFPAESHTPKAYREIDEGILPLVKALNAKGVRTLSSCQGHIEERYGLVIPWPWVSVVLKDWNKVRLKLPEGWELSQYPTHPASPVDVGAHTVLVQMNKVAATEEELVEMQKSIQEWAAKLA